MWGDSTMFFTRGEVTIENLCRIASLVTKIVFRGNECIISFLPRYVLYWRDISAKKQVSIANFAIAAKDRFFWTSIVTSAQFDLWRHVKVGYWHCDVIYADFSCTRKLAQRWSSLVNNNREYRFLTTRFSRLSVQEYISFIMKRVICPIKI